MKCKYACQTADHQMARRSFLGLTAAGLGLSAFAQPAAAKQLSGADQRVLVIFLRGGLSQLESWDPKPYTENGGPFRPISTSVPGIQISELLPHTAQNMHRLSIVRSLNSKEADHGRGLYSMTTGRKKEAASEYPHLGAVTSRLLTSANSPMPGFIRVSAKGAGIHTRDAAYLGAKYASMTLADGQTPPNSTRAATLTPDRDTARQQLRQRMSDRFATRRRTAETEAYTYSYDQAAQLMERADLFDVTREPLREQERYGKHDFGRHLLLARRLLENGVTFAEVSHSNYDTHYENFEYHIEQLDNNRCRVTLKTKNWWRDGLSGRTRRNEEAVMMQAVGNDLAKLKIEAEGLVARSAA